MTAADFAPYKDKHYKGLEKLAEKHFNAFIRWRDSQEIKGGFVCISCRELKPVEAMHAGHFFSAGHYPILRFDEKNVHAQCHRCNTFLHGNLIHYREGLVRKLGMLEVAELELKARMKGYRIDRWTLIETIITYKNKLKNHVLEKNDLCGGLPDGAAATGGIQRERRTLFQFTGGGKPTGKKIRGAKDAQEAQQAQPKDTQKTQSGKD
jgi:hypothetical protein